MRLLTAAVSLAWSFHASLAGAATQSVAFGTSTLNADSCLACHAAMRMRRPGPADPSAPPTDAGSYDAVVVGGGLSGLTAAYDLRDYRVLVLDGDFQVGAEARLGSIGGRLQPLSRVVVDPKNSAVQELLKSLRLKTHRAARSRHALAKNGKTIFNWITDDPSNLPYPKPAQIRLREMQDKLKELAASRTFALPVENIDPKILERYEPYSFFQWMDNNYGPQASELADMYARNLFGVSAQEISAPAGLSFFSSEFSPVDTWDGGLDAVDAALQSALGPAISTGAYVWKVSQDLDGAVVDFSRDGRDYEVRSRAVVLALPALITRRVATGLSEPKRKALSRVRYSSFLVMPFNLKATRWADSLIYWTPDRKFTDLEPQRTSDLGPSATGQILVAYAPMGESAGRHALLSATNQELAQGTIDDFNQAFPDGASETVEALVLRWGHAVPVPYPGYLTETRPALAAPEGRLFFAGVETELPSIEGAVISGASAAAEARGFLKTLETPAPERPR